MGFRILPTILPYFIVYSLAFEDFIYVYGDGNKEMVQQGRAQYEIIKERGTLPKYGPCWKTALQHLNEGCRYLSETTQSDIALTITNCFLEMSGHETYNCELDKKPNLRGICINSMSDRAFNVYTEFYTHTQNICWFLRGQIWHETIAENTLNVGKQLELSASLAAEFHQDLIKTQKESFELQQKMVEQGRFLEKVLEDVYVSTKAHQDILKVLTQSVTSLQTWIVGEVSWIDSILFNIFALFVILIITSSQRTLPARLPLFFLLFLNMIIERLICSFYTKYSEEFETHNLYSNLYSFVWYSRYGFMFIGAMLVLYIGLTYQDIFEKNLVILNKITQQNADILTSMKKFGRTKTPSINFVNEDTKNSPYCKGKLTYSQIDNSDEYHSKLFDSQNKKYQLRSYSRQETPDSGIAH
ncbi:unnamed protein product [Ceutorhynchus assimilis]|uniref:Uncharacterized protein n=1 Tax=Ceutorhynchus assimilis TaxID=467358 RepID=A0A9N9MN65_9CUCU|nr:unnamed protein product [Ceutorhynchus assimilis]